MKHRIRTTCFLLLMFATLSAAAQENYVTLNTSLAPVKITAEKDIASFFINAKAFNLLEANPVTTDGSTRLITLAATTPFERVFSVTAVLADGTIAPFKLRYVNVSGLPDYHIERRNFKPARILAREGKYPVSVSMYQDLFLTFPAEILSVVNASDKDIRWRIVMGTVAEGKGLTKRNILALHATNAFPQSRTIHVYLKNGRKYTLEVFYSYYNDELDILSGEIR